MVFGACLVWFSMLELLSSLVVLLLMQILAESAAAANKLFSVSKLTLSLLEIWLFVLPLSTSIAVFVLLFKVFVVINDALAVGMLFVSFDFLVLSFINFN